MGRQARLYSHIVTVGLGLLLQMASHVVGVLARPDILD